MNGSTKVLEKINAKKGEQIFMFLERMLEKSKATNAELLVVHNDRHVIVRPDSDTTALGAIWSSGGVPRLPETTAA